MNIFAFQRDHMGYVVESGLEEARVDVVVFESLSHVQLFVTLWTIAHQAPLSMGFSRQEYWSGLPCPPPGDLPNSGTEPMSPALASRLFTTEPPGKPVLYTFY